MSRQIELPPKLRDCNRYYMAIAKNGKWACGITYGQQWSECKPIGDFRLFNTFEEADQVAKDTAKGKYNYPPGKYINNR